ncbi:MAG: hypothetical protein JJ971_06610 [Balneolaceae bacterium]|nr:hypothetical protein [Balneolaceae bacterium]MBO6546046.1 hypothetical protein [Balneolaceae bacterium]MBO6647442.1 hypothetical protein [Balneolaceae bacterium]
MKTVALVLGGYINGLSVVRELHERNVSNIWLFDTQRSLATRSKKISGFSIIENTPESLLNEVLSLKKQFDHIVFFPTADNHLELLAKVYDEVKSFSFLPLNESKIHKQLDKYYQYEVCDKIGIPYPKTFQISSLSEIEILSDFTLPILLKPSKRDDFNSDLFRSHYIDSAEKLKKLGFEIKPYLKQGVTFIASEFIPGPDNNIYAYTAYRNRKGVICGSWCGKKLSQYPDQFGVFSSAINEYNDQVHKQGKKLLEELDVFGVAEPEFKYDTRDRKFKLMEVNLRPMMWHRLGHLSEVSLIYSQWLDSINHEIPLSNQIKSEDISIHYVYFKHEIINLFFRKKYFPIFAKNLFNGKKTYFSVFMINDLTPFIFDSIATLKTLLSRCLNLLQKR